MNKEEIFAHIQELMNELFELEIEDIHLESRLREELDLDSIDAVDMVAQLQKVTGRRLELTKLAGIRTVSDVVELVHEHLRPGESLGQSS